MFIYQLGRNWDFPRRQYEGAVVFLVDMPLHTTMCDWHDVYFRTAHTWQIGVTVHFPPCGWDPHGREGEQLAVTPGRKQHPTAAHSQGCVITLHITHILLH